MSTTVAVVVFDGLDELDALGPYEVFSTASQCGADIDLRLVTVDGAAEVRGAHGVTFRSQGTLGSDPDVLIVPGGGWSNRADRGAWQQSRDGVLPRRIAEIRGEATLIGSVCTGGMLLAEAGLLQGRRAVTHHAALAELAGHGVRVVEARVVDDGDIVSSGGVTAGLDLALHLVGRLFGDALREAVEEELEYRRAAAEVAGG